MGAPTCRHRLEIGTRPQHRDPRGEALEGWAERELGLTGLSVRTRDVYRIDAPIDAAEAARVLVELVDPVTQVGAIGRVDPGDGPFDAVVTVGAKPGVTDPVGKSAKVAVEDTLGRKLPAESEVFSSVAWCFRGVAPAEAERIALERLANPVVQTVTVESWAEHVGRPPDLSVPRVESHAVPRVERVPLPDDDAVLERLSRERLLSLSLAEMRATRAYFLSAGDEPGRVEAGLGGDPTDVELEMIAQTWSEHCKHKIFNATIRYREGDREEVVRSVFKTYVRGATEAVERTLELTKGKSWLVSLFHDNAGVVAFDEEDHLVMKVETHNSPSALDPYGGAMTGIVGVNRDPFGTGLGAELLTNVWGYCFGPSDYAGALPKGLLHPRRVRDGVHHGVIDGGNQSGVPYGRGWELFDERFSGKPLVFCGTVGKLPVTIGGQPGHEKGARPGDRVVMVGGRIGKDGIHGATFSSLALDETAPIQAVQIGDPITQKRMFDFLLEARDLGLYSAITDNGAGGLSSSIGEMAQASGGVDIDLARAPLKYPGLMPWEILVSEAQERMSLAVPPESVLAFLALAQRREVEATVLGTFTDDGYFLVRHEGAVVARVSLGFLHRGAPPLEIAAEWRAPSFEAPPPDLVRPPLDVALLGMLAAPNERSLERRARTYDHEVKALAVVKPFVGVGRDVPAEGTVHLVRLGSRRGYVLSESVNPFYSDLDAYGMAQAVVDEAVRRQIAAGATLDRIALLDNFCWPDPVESDKTPDGRYKAAQLVRACRGLADAVMAYGTPLVSGKDSMKNDSWMGGVKISVPPTLLVSAIGQIPDVLEALTLEPKVVGDVVWVLGPTADELGASAYHRWLGEVAERSAPLGRPQPFVGGQLPRLALSEALPRYAAVERLVRAGRLRSIAVPARGGLGLAFARMVLGARLGLAVDLDAVPGAVGLASDVLLFSESLGRLVLTAAPEHAAEVEAALGPHGLGRVGEVVATPTLELARGGVSAARVSASALDEAFHGFERRSEP